jgi:hypothetical protein
MFRRRRRTSVSRYVVEDGQHLLEHAVALGQHAPVVQRHPGPLVLSVPALHFFVYAFLDFALEDSGTGRLVEVGDFEDVGRIDPVVGTAAHDVVAGDIELVDGDLQKLTLAVFCIFAYM